MTAASSWWLCSPNSFDLGVGPPNVYVSRKGIDSESCGSKNQPCKSIIQAVKRVSFGGFIYLDGRGTLEHPYDCSNPNSSVACHHSIHVTKSLTIKGIYFPPHILCVGGFHFQWIVNEQQNLRFELSGIHFRQTPFTCKDCKRIVIHNCSFRDTERTFIIETQNISSVQLDVHGDSSFRYNSQCFEFLLFDDCREQNRFLPKLISLTQNSKKMDFMVRRIKRSHEDIVRRKEVARSSLQFYLLL